MMDRMWGDGAATALWVLVVVLAAVAAFLDGFLTRHARAVDDRVGVGQQRSRSKHG